MENKVIYKLLIIENDIAISADFKKNFEVQQLSYSYTIFSSIKEALRKFTSLTFDALVFDYDSGGDAFFDFKEKVKNIPIIFIASPGDEEAAIKALNSGVSEYLVKDPERNFIKLLPFMLERAIERKAFEKKIKIFFNAVYVKSEKELQKLAEYEARKVIQVKSEFFAKISHEIRTPMNAIMGMAELLWDTKLTEEQQRYVRIFRSAGESLLDLINDILDISKIESGHLHLEEIEFNLLDLIEKTFDMLSLKAHQQGLELLCHIDADVQLNLIGDPTRLRQIIVNLVGNAIKFTDSGEISLDVKKDPGGGDGSILFSVKDTGIGISKEVVANMFSKFMQADISTARKYGGSGLGLSISKQLVELMNGSIWVESEAGKGSTFFCNPKFKIQSNSSTLITLSDVRLDSLKMLIVDHNLTSQSILADSLKMLGAEVDCFRELPSEFDCGRYDIIFIDNHAIESVEGKNNIINLKKNMSPKQFMVVMLTTDTLSHIISWLRIHNVEYYITKPIKYTALFETLLNALTRCGMVSDRMIHAQQIRKSEVECVKPAKILLVEDSQTNRMLILAYLKNTLHTVDTAENGEAAYLKYRQTKYDLVFMDMQMPVMDGYDATKFIREYELQKGITPVPIIALTAFAFETDAARSIAAGCTDCLTKPIKKTILIETINKFLKIAEFSQK